MSLYPPGAATRAPPNQLAGFEWPLRGRRKERKGEEEWERGRDRRKHPGNKCLVASLRRSTHESWAEAMRSLIATEQVLGGLQINRWKGESTPLCNHVNVVVAILPAIYMHCAGPSCLVSLVYSHKPFCSPTRCRRRRVIRSNQWMLPGVERCSDILASGAAGLTDWTRLRRSSSPRASTTKPMFRNSQPLRRRHFITGQKCAEGTVGWDRPKDRVESESSWSERVASASSARRHWATHAPLNRHGKLAALMTLSIAMVTSYSGNSSVHNASQVSNRLTALGSFVVPTVYRLWSVSKTPVNNSALCRPHCMYAVLQHKCKEVYFLFITLSVRSLVN